MRIMLVMPQQIGKTAMAATLGMALVLGGTVACGSDEPETVAVEEVEDCDVEDQKNKEDDCGYWQKGSQVHVGAQPDNTWIWVWFAWVIINQNSRPPAGWTPPHGIKPQTRTVYKPKTQVCALAPAPPRPPAPAPRVNNPAPPRVNTPPKAPAGGGNRNPAPNRPRGC